MKSYRKRGSSNVNSRKLDYDKLEARNLLASIDVGLSFTSATGGGSNSVHIAGDVSTEHVLQFANNRFSIFNEADGSLVRTSNNRLFWSEAGMDLTSLPLKTQVLYTNDRWVAAAIDADNPNRVVIAVSESSDPNGVWKSTSFLADPTGNSILTDLDVSNFYSPHDPAIVISTTSNASFNHQSLFAIPSDDLFSVTPTTSNMKSKRLNAQVLGESLEVAREWNSFHDLFYSLEDEGTILKATRAEFKGYGFTFPYEGREVEVPFYEPAPDARQPGGIPLNPASPSASLSAATSRYTTLVAHNTKGSFDNVAIRWYLLGRNSELLDTGLIEDPNIDLLQPTVALSLGSYGHFATFSISYTATGPDLFPSSAISMGHYILSPEISATFEPMEIVQEGSADYNNPDAVGINRLAQMHASRTTEMGRHWAFSAYAVGPQSWATNASEHRLIDLEFVYESSGDFSSQFAFYFRHEFGATLLRSFEYDAGDGNDSIWFDASYDESISNAEFVNIQGGNGNDTLAFFGADGNLGLLTLNGESGDDNLSIHELEDLTFSVQVIGGDGSDWFRMEDHLDGLKHTIGVESFSEKQDGDFLVEYSGLESFSLAGDIDIYTPEPGTKIHNYYDYLFAPYRNDTIQIHDPAAFVDLRGYFFSKFVTQLADEMNFVLSGGLLQLSGTTGSDQLEIFEDYFVYNEGTPVQVNSHYEIDTREGDDSFIIHSESWSVDSDREFKFTGGAGVDRLMVVGDDESNEFKLSRLDFGDLIENLHIDLGLGDDQIIGEFGYESEWQDVQISDPGGDDILITSRFTEFATFDIDLGAGNDEYAIGMPFYSVGDSADQNPKFYISDSQGDDRLTFRQPHSQDGALIRYEGNLVTYGTWMATFESIEHLTFDFNRTFDDYKSTFILNSPVLAPVTEIYLGIGASTVLANSADLQSSNELTIFGEDGDDVVKVKPGFLAPLKFLGGSGEDTITVSLSNFAAGRIDLASGDTEFLNVIGQDERESVVVRDNRLVSKSPENQILRTIEFGDSGSASLIELNIDLKNGDDITTVYSTPARSLIVEGRSGRDYFWILGTQSGRDFIFNGGSGLDVFHIEETSANTFTTLRGHTQNDLFYFGSTRNADNGNLGLLSGRVDVDAGGGDDWIYLNDNAADSNFGYHLGNTYIGNQVTQSTPDRPEFKGVYYDDTAERIRLDANDRENFFTVVPNVNTAIVVDGRSPVFDEGSNGIGDVLYVPGGGDGRSLVEYGPNNGIFSFTNGSKKIRYYSIEKVTRPAQEAAGRSSTTTLDSNETFKKRRELGVINLRDSNLSEMLLPGDVSSSAVAGDIRGFLERTSDDLPLHDWLDLVSQEQELD